MISKRGLTFLSVLWACLFSLQALAQDKHITVGAKEFSEQLNLAHLAKHVLEKEGFEVTLKTNLPTTILRQALESGEVDFYYEYTGTAYTVFYKQKDQEIMSDVEKGYNWVKEADAKKGLIWLDMVKFNNTYSIMMQKADSQALGIKTLTDYVNYVKNNPDKPLKFAISAEFYAREDGFKPLAKAYNFHKNMDLVKMDFGLIYKALQQGDIDLGMGYTTDGRIAAWGFTNLEDDKNFFPKYHAAPVVRKSVLEAYPELPEILAPIAKNLDRTAIQEMNAAVDIYSKSPAVVTKAWLDTIK